MQGDYLPMQGDDLFRHLRIHCRKRKKRKDKK